MDHIGTQRLETERLVLRRFTLDDAPAMFENWASDAEVTRFLTWQPHASVEVTRSVLADWVSSYEQPDFYQWAIVPKQLGDEPIGSISVVGMSDSVSMVHIGYCIGRPWWHQGMTYLCDDGEQHRSAFGEPPIVCNYFYHEEVRKSAKRG